ncbi:hypothetical protein Hanom_Chr02g00174561 [Helianthus anomalus]
MKCRLKYYLCVAYYHFAINIISFTHTQSFEISRKQKKKKKASHPRLMTSRAPHAIQNPVSKPEPPPK